ncbi:MAG TPA: hypothetical protein VFM18_13775 [Methanosarcina sp.]|nr:hypothetical protein [Methanosarcina sp.]
MKNFRAPREDFQDYRNRDFAGESELDDRVFDLMNDGADPSGLTLMMTGCLDALDEIPAGSMNVVNGWYDRTLVIRGVSLDEQKRIDKLLDELIDEILMEES